MRILDTLYRDLLSAMGRNWSFSIHWAILPGPTPNTVLDPGAICVLPASRIRLAFNPRDLAFFDRSRLRKENTISLQNPQKLIEHKVSYDEITTPLYEWTCKWLTEPARSLPWPPPWADQSSSICWTLPGYFWPQTRQHGLQHDNTKWKQQNYHPRLQHDNTKS